MSDYGDKLFKSNGVLWITVVNQRGHEFVSDTPLCPNSSCHMPLEQKEKNYFCPNCNKIYLCPLGFFETKRRVKALWEGHKTLKLPIYSLDLPPTKVLDEDKEDENYWVQARISEKDGKRMAVVYFGERVKNKQTKEDYVQVFLDFEDEQLRFDKSNKNPMKLLAKLTAEFPQSTTEIKQLDGRLGKP